MPLDEPIKVGQFYYATCHELKPFKMDNADYFKMT
jgi:hypothetical protein